MALEGVQIRLMPNNEHKFSLSEFWEKANTVRIPAYQRGYIWGQKSIHSKDSVLFLLESILAKFQPKENKENKELFLQGITVVEGEGETRELIDGQQRITTLYLLLVYLGNKPKTAIDYAIRDKAQRLLDNFVNLDRNALVEACKENRNEEYQDVYYIKKAIRTIHKCCSEFDADTLDTLAKHILENISFLYIKIPREKAMKVFTMMNGDKAPMRDEEIIKAEMLRLVSHGLANNEDPREREELIQIRSRYSREWDKWLYWWNRPDVLTFFCHTRPVMGWLLPIYYLSWLEEDNTPFNYDNFRDRILNKKQPKQVFKELREMQKKFEDVFNSYDHKEKKKRLCNNVGLILNLDKSSDNQLAFLKYLLDKSKSPFDIDMEKYARLALIGLTPKQIQSRMNSGETPQEDDSDADIKEKVAVYLEAISHPFIYGKAWETAFRILLRKNVEQDTELKRRFDFTIIGEKSLEHIYPKSKVWHLKPGSDEEICLSHEDKPLPLEVKTDPEYLSRTDFLPGTSEHCLGNLVLLYGKDNSHFGNKSFEHKKNSYFNIQEVTLFRSRHLLHSLSVFAESQWGWKEIGNKLRELIDKEKEIYKEYLYEI